MHCPMTDKRCHTPMTCHHESRCEAAANPLLKPLPQAANWREYWPRHERLTTDEFSERVAQYGASASPTPMPPVRSWLARTFDDITAELERAAKYPDFNSAHEGYGVLLEEMDELKAHVWTNQKKRDLDAMRAEAIQVAAMAIKFVKMLDNGRGRV